MHDAFWKSHDAGIGDVKLLQVDQLTDTFGKRGHAPSREVQLGHCAEVGVVEEGARNRWHALAMLQDAFHALLVKVDQLPDTFGERHGLIAGFKVLDEG